MTCKWLISMVIVSPQDLDHVGPRTQMAFHSMAKKRWGLDPNYLRSKSWEPILQVLDDFGLQPGLVGAAKPPAPARSREGRIFPMS